MVYLNIKLVYLRYYKLILYTISLPSTSTAGWDKLIGMQECYVNEALHQNCEIYGICFGENMTIYTEIVLNFRISSSGYQQHRRKTMAIQWKFI